MLRPRSEGSRCAHRSRSRGSTSVVGTLRWSSRRPRLSSANATFTYWLSTPRACRRPGRRCRSARCCQFRLKNRVESCSAGRQHSHGALSPRLQVGPVPFSSRPTALGPVDRSITRQPNLDVCDSCGQAGPQLTPILAVAVHTRRTRCGSTDINPLYSRRMHRDAYGRASTRGPTMRIGVPPPSYVGQFRNHGHNRIGSGLVDHARGPRVSAPTPCVPRQPTVPGRRQG